ncbi:MAG TPA: hypothetical protein VGE22_05950 [Solimonas sp.]
MLLNAAAKGLRRGIANIDTQVISRTVQQAFHWVMLYVDEPGLKGGTAALLIKDQAQQRRQQALAATANPVDLSIIGQRGRAALLRQYFEGLELRVDDIMPSEEELAAREQGNQMQPGLAEAAPLSPRGREAGREGELPVGT